MGAGGDSGDSGKRGFFSSAVDWASTLTAGDIGHTVLDVGGLVPGWGEAADAANAAWYAGEGNYTDALFSAISLVPVAGDIIGKGGKVAMRVINAGGPTAVKEAKKLLGQLNDIGIDNLKSIFNKFLPKDLAEKLSKELDDLVAKLEKVIKGEADEAGEAGAVIKGDKPGDAPPTQIQKNRDVGKEWGDDVVKNQLPKTQSHIESEITILSGGPSGKKVRMDAVGFDADGNIRLTEAKGSQTAPLTKNQKIVFDELQEFGGTVVGKGKGEFSGGKSIPPTKVDIIRKE